MKADKIVKKQIVNLPVYETGKPIEYVAREFGLDPDGILKMASNENPLGASPKAVEAVKNHLGGLNYYPDGGCYELRQKLSKNGGLRPPSSHSGTDRTKYSNSWRSASWAKATKLFSGRSRS